MIISTTDFFLYDAQTKAPLLQEICNNENEKSNICSL